MIGVEMTNSMLSNHIVWMIRILMSF